MKYWVATFLFILFSASANAEVSGAVQDLIERKRSQAAQAQKISDGKIEYLRNNKDKTNIIGTGAHYNLDDLETASGSKPAEKAEPDKTDKVKNKKLLEEPKAPSAPDGNLKTNTKIEAPETPQPL